MAGSAALSGSLVTTAAIALAGPAAQSASAIDFSASFVKDINLAEAGSRPSRVTQVGATSFFVADDPAGGRELWKSDGSSGGTVMVKDIRPGGSSSYPSQLTAVGGTLYFTADDDSGGTELWKSDGSASGTVRVKDIRPGGSSSYPSRLTAVGGTVYFTADDGSSGTELWKSDGTSAGTVLVKDIRPGAAGSNSYSGYGYYDGASLANVGGTLYFAANDGSSGTELWKSDGTSAGTVLVKDINPGVGYYSDSSPRNLTNVGGTLYFAADDGSTGRELWKSDGTSGGTVLVKDIRPGASSGVVGYGYYDGDSFTNMGGTLYFVANDGSTGRELWKSDGSAAGTVLVEDINPGTDYSGNAPRDLTNVGGMLYFAAGDGSTGRELWKSDGTSAGTVLVKDIRLGGSSSYPSRLTAVGGTVYFTADDGSSGRELWKSDGTSAGTVLVKDIRPGAASGTAGYGYTSFANVGGTLYFAATDGSTGTELWKSDGTSAGTVLVRNIVTGSSYGGVGDYYYSSSVNVNGTLFFPATDGSGDTELWKSDGSAGGTVRVKDIRPGSLSSSPSRLTAVGGTLYFTADDGSSGRELWKSDGTSAGTVLVKDVNPGASYYYSASSYPRNLTNVGGTLYFAADDGSSGQELWKSDGTSGGTVLVEDINPGVGYYSASSPRNLTNVGGTLYFAANDGSTGRELWKSDGTSGGTVLVKDIRPGSSGGVGYGGYYDDSFTSVGGTLYFAANDGSTGRELWKSDGTSGGTVLVKDIRPGSSGGLDYYGYYDGALLANVGGMLYFAANDGSTGTELWKSNGGAGGTVRVQDIHGGSAGSYPRFLTAVGDRLLFVAADATSGSELWESNGATARVRDIRAGSGGSNPTSLVNAGGTLFFAANDGATGPELWKATRATSPGDPSLPGDGTGSGSGNPSSPRDGGSGSGTGGRTDNSFTLPGKRAQKANTKNGTLRLTFDFPGPGVLDGKQAKGGKATSSAKKKSGKRPKRSQALVKPASVRVKSAGKATFTLRPTSQALKALKGKLAKLAKKKKAGRVTASLKVPVTFTFRPTGGTARSRTGTFVLKLSAAGKSKKKAGPKR